MLFVENCLIFVPLALVGKIEKLKQLNRYDQRCEGFLKKILMDSQSNPCYRGENGMATLNWIKRPKRHSWCFSLKPKMQLLVQPLMKE